MEFSWSLGQIYGVSGTFFIYNVWSFGPNTNEFAARNSQPNRPDIRRPRPEYILILMGAEIHDRTRNHFSFCSGTDRRRCIMRIFLLGLLALLFVSAVQAQQPSLNNAPPSTTV